MGRNLQTVYVRLKLSSILREVSTRVNIGLAVRRRIIHGVVGTAKILDGVGEARRLPCLRETKFFAFLPLSTLALSNSVSLLSTYFH